ncbi:type II toxin-antitoxin system Phd/YefM family antitoxin [Luteimonas sp. MJ246]|uniref:type II toxin-antitoxin system Phd/YefM family antitoxin n=1 Tax=Luteimonas sp. MJ174 TaxID=3129237 RepID=UPI0031BB542D
MTITTLSSRELNQDLGRAKKAALDGPVVITDRGKPAHVLLSYADYLRLSGKRRSLLEALSMSGMEDVEFDPPKLEIKLRIPDFED